MAKNNKSDKKLYEKKTKEIFDTKQFFIKYSKRYGITLLCCFPIIMIINYVLNLNVSWYKAPISFLLSFAMLLLSCLISMIIYNKIDEIKNSTPIDPEKEKDPFAD